MSKIYEASTLLAAMKQRLTEYTALQEQLLAVKTEFEVIVQMEDELQGEGAKAIKNFFQAQAKVVDAWVDFISMQTSFLSAISGDMEEADLSGKTYIQESFLEQECLNGLTNAITMTMAQREELQSIFHRIDDILPLEMYDAEPYYEKVGDAGKERSDTVAALNKLDQQWKQEYQHSEAGQSNILGLLGELLKASSQGGTVSPMSFDEQAFHDSEIYQLQGEMKKYTDEYVQFKEEQADTREQVKKAMEMEARPWYEKTWDTVSTFTGEITGYYDYKRASEGIDPVTGEKLSDAQRIAAGAMAAAGFIPVVGWAGRAAKGGSAIYKTTKGMNAATHTLDAYKSAKSFDVLQKTEMGIYGLVAANGLSEYMNGQDMFGNELTEEQRQNSLYSALGIAGVAGAAKYIDHLQVKNAPFETSKGNTRTITRNKGEFEALVRLLKEEKGHIVLPGKKAGAGHEKLFGKYSTAIDDKVKVIEKVDLPEWISESFTDSTYRTVITQESITFYRTYGGSAQASGSFVTTSPAGNRINAKISTALVPDWKNSRQYEAVIEVPKGQLLNIGRVEKQYTKSGALLEGDGDQILLPQGWPSEWIKETREVPSR